MYKLTKDKYNHLLDNAVIKKETTGMMPYKRRRHKVRKKIRADVRGRIEINGTSNC